MLASSLLFFFCFSNGKALHRMDSHQFDDNDHDIQVIPISHAVLSWVPAVSYYSHDKAATYQLQLEQKRLGSPREPGIRLGIAAGSGVPKLTPGYLSKIMTCPLEDSGFNKLLFPLWGAVIKIYTICYYKIMTQFEGIMLFFILRKEMEEGQKRYFGLRI